MTSLRSLALAVSSAAISIAPLTAQGVPNPDVDRAHHVLRRITFGPTPALIAQLSTGQAAIDAYIQEQLNPSPATDPNWPYGSQAVEDLVAPGGTLNLPTTIGDPISNADTTYAQLAFGLESKWQLREVMTQVIERFFNTAVINQDGFFAGSLTGTQTTEDYAWGVEWEANKYIRLNCFTTFANLLAYHSTHASMMVYLNVPQNDKDSKNENYARELLELYSIGFDNYDQSDIEKITCILTGWDVDPNNGYQFLYEDADHEYAPGPVTLFASTGNPVTLATPAPPNGVVQGYRLLRALAARDETKDHFCRRLIREFIGEGVADQPGSTVLADMKAAWGIDGDIKAILNVMFSSTEFYDPANYNTLARLPLESVLAVSRAVEGKIKYVPDPAGGPDLADPGSMLKMLIALESQGMSLLRYGAPNGFPTYNAAQMSPSIAMERVYFASHTFFQAPVAGTLDIDPEAFMASVQPPLGNPPNVFHFLGAADHILSTLYGSNYTLEDELRVLDGMVGAVNYINTFGTLGLMGPWDPLQSQHYWLTMASGMSAAMGMVQSGVR